VRPFRSSRSFDLLLGGAIGAVVVIVALLAVRRAPPPRPAAAVPVDTATRGTARPEPADSLTLPVVVPDTAPADRPLRRELRRLRAAQAAWFDREGSYAANAVSVAYWPVALATISFDVDTVGDSWTASAYDPDSRRQCAIRVGPAPEPYFNPLADGVIACRTLPDTAEFAMWGPSPPTTVWEDGTGRRARAGSAVLRRLRSMQVAWLADEGDDGSDFIRLRDGQARVPYPDEPGPRRASEDGTVYLADATWGDLDHEGRWVAVVRLVENTGGTALDGYLAVVRERAGRLVNGVPYYIGDRTSLLRLRATHGIVTADMVVHGEHDPRCCPTDTVRSRFSIRGDSLVEIEEPPGSRLSAGRAGRAAAGPLSSC